MSLLPGFDLLRPQALLLLLPWLWVAFGRAAVGQGVGATPHSSPATPWARWIDAALLPHLLAESPVGRHPPRRWPLLLLGLLLILALAGPRVLRPGEPVNPPPMRPDSARVLVADLSPGFAALSEADRTRLRIDLRRFLRALPPGETALVVAAGGAWTVVPLTEDQAALDAFIDELSVDAVPVAGDRPALALALARRLLADSGARERRIFWLRAGEIPTALRPAGASGDSLEFLQATAGADAWLAAANASQLGEARAGWRDSALNLSPPPDQRWIDLGPYLALLALPLAAIGWRTAVTTLVLCALIGAPLETASASSMAAAPAEAFERGVALYRAGDFAAAAAAFARAEPDDARAHYNRGNALAKAGRLRAALAAYDEALRRRPDDAATRHNRAIVESLLQPPPPSPPPPPPPPPPPKGAPPPPSPASVEARRAAEQWLRKPPADHDGLLRRKLALEEARRRGEGAR